MKLNLGSGSKRLPGYLNVDKAGDPEFRWDLESTPWPWPDNSVEEILLVHVLEHLGETSKSYFAILREIYRVCRAGATIKILVPHPRHDDFLNDPTHVRPITPEGLQLLSKRKNLEWIKAGGSDTPLALELGVDFELVHVNFQLEPPWHEDLKSGRCSSAQVQTAIRQLNNVVKQIDLELRVVK